MNSPSAKTRPARKRKWLKRGVWALVGYTVFGFLILPLIIKAVAVQQLKKALNRETAIESVRFNPYAMSITIRGLTIKDPDTQPLLSWDEVHVNFQLRSVFSRAWAFDNIRVINPYFRVQLNKDRSFNFSDIIESFATADGGAKPVGPRKLVAVGSRRLLIEGARLEVTDFTPSKPFHRLVGPVKLELNNFHTDPNSRNPHVFTGRTDTGETFAWAGSFSLEPLSAAGEFSVENIALQRLAPLYQDLVNFEIRDGLAAFRVNYAFEMSPTVTNAAVSNLTVSLHSLKLAQPGQAGDLIEVPECSVTGVSGDLLARRIDVGLVSVRGAGLNVHRDSQARINFLEAAAPNTNASAPAGVLLVLQAATNLISHLLTSTNLATATIREIAVRDCFLNYSDDSCSPPARLTVDQIQFTARNLSNRPDTNMTSEVSLRWNTNGSVAVGVSASLHPLEVDTRLDVKRLDLAPLDPYLRPHLNAYVLGSKVGLDGRVHLAVRSGELPEVTFAGNAALDDLNVLGSTSEDLLKFGALRLDGIAASLQPLSVSVSNVTLKDLAARVVMESNRTLNVLAVLPAADTNALAATTPGASSEGDGAVRGGGIKQVFAQVKTVLGLNTNAAATLGLPKVEVGSVRVENSAVQFVDRSVTPEAQFSLQQIQAEISDISTEAMQRAKIRVQTLVGGTGPVEVNAELNPLQAKQATHARVSVRKVQLRPADPYAGKFLGYHLTRGQVDVDMDYTISASQVKGSNVIVLDQLTLGSKVSSPDATSLPVKLGIALLKDSSGRIEINVPVEGSLDDPEFRLGKVIWGVVANVFVKAVTSPFSLLGSLVGGGGGEEMQFQEFATGSSELDDAAREKLASLAKALTARPELQVALEGNVDPELDGWELRRAKMEQQLRLARWNSLRASARESVKPEEMTIPPEVRSGLVQSAYRALVATNAQLAFASVPEAVVRARTNVTAVAGLRSRATVEKGASRLLSDEWMPPVPSKPVAGEAAAAPQTPTGKPTSEQMENSLVAAQPMASADYAALATARVQRVQSHLVGGLQVAPDRVLLGEPASGTFGTNGNRVILQLQ